MFKYISESDEYLKKVKVVTNYVHFFLKVLNIDIL